MLFLRVAMIFSRVTWVILKFYSFHILGFRDSSELWKQNLMEELWKRWNEKLIWKRQKFIRNQFSTRMIGSVLSKTFCEFHLVTMELETFLSDSVRYSRILLSVKPVIFPDRLTLEEFLTETKIEKVVWRRCRWKLKRGHMYADEVEKWPPRACCCCCCCCCWRRWWYCWTSTMEMRAGYTPHRQQSANVGLGNRTCRRRVQPPRRR